MISWHLSVDGHDWVVRDRPAEPGVHDLEWLTGPAGYGFTVGSSDGAPIGEPRLRELIAGFLAQVDPATGYPDRPTGGA